jgi:hypothetical protein
MVRRKAEALGMRGEIGQPNGLGIDDEQPEDTLAGRWRPDPLHLLDGQSHRDELGETGPLFVEDPQRAVAGIGHGSGLFYDVVQERREVEVRLEEHCRLEYPAQLGRILDRTVGRLVLVRPVRHHRPG